MVRLSLPSFLNAVFLHAVLMMCATTLGPTWNLPQRPFLFLPLGCPRKRLNGVSSSKKSGSRTVDPATLAAKPDDEALVEALADEASPAALAAKPDDEALAEALADEVPPSSSRSQAG